MHQNDVFSQSTVWYILGDDQYYTKHLFIQLHPSNTAYLTGSLIQNLDTSQSISKYLGAAI